MYVQHDQRPDTRSVVRRSMVGSILVLAFWGALALLAWGVFSATGPPAAQAAAATPAGPAAAATTAGPTAAATAHYVDQARGFSFDYPAEWTPSTLAPGDAPGAVLGLPANPVPASVGGVEFPFSSHIDLSVIVQDTAAPGAAAWGTAPSDILAGMAASEGLPQAVAEGRSFRATTSGGVEVWGLEYTPAFGTERMWVVAPAGGYNYLFFLTVGGAAEDRGTVQQMFDEVIPSFTVICQT